jgi:hypothetical protein
MTKFFLWHVVALSFKNERKRCHLKIRLLHTIMNKDTETHKVQKGKKRSSTVFNRDVFVGSEARRAELHIKSWLQKASFSFSSRRSAPFASSFVVASLSKPAV